MFCTECGNKLDDGTRFCPFCGTPVFAAPAAEEPAKDAEEGPAQEAVEEAVEPVIEKVEEAAEEPADTVEETAEEIQETVDEEIRETVAEEAPEPVKESPAEPIDTAQSVETPALDTKKPAAATPETIAMVLAAVSLICLFISFTKGVLVSRIFYIIAAACLTFLAARKEKYPSVLFAVPVCIVALVNVFNSARLIFISITNRYYRYRPAAYNSLYKLILIAVFVMLLLLGVNAVRSKKALNKVIFAGSALLAIYHIVFFFVNLRRGRAVVFFNLAMLLFFAAYVVISLHFEKTGQDDPEKEFESEPATGRTGERRNYSYAGTRTAAPSASTERGPLFGPAAVPSEPVKTAVKGSAPMFAESPADTEFAEKPETPAEDYVIDPDFIFCIRCGAKLPADSAFCNKCGAPVIK